MGDKVFMPKFAETLQAIADGGVNAFYRGKIAEGIVNTVQASQGDITLDDLYDYTSLVEEVAPLKANFRGKIYGYSLVLVIICDDNRVYILCPSSTIWWATVPIHVVCDEQVLG